MKTFLKATCLLLFASTLYSQSNCTPIPEVNFPGGRVVMSFDGNVHDDDDILALPYATGLWWAAGLKDKVVQVEYNNHICLINNSEVDGSGPGSGDDSQNMRNSASGAISRFGYNSNIFYDYETQGNASTSKMASEIEKSTASNPLWIIAGGPMETVWRGLESATKGHDHVTVISHSSWNENHLHCGNDHNWDSLKNKYLSRGVYFVGFCSGSGCSAPTGLYDQNGGFSSAVSNWSWMQSSSKEYNRWIFSRNPFGTSKFDPSDAGMSYFLISGGPFNGGEKRADHNDARKLMENPCTANVPPVQNSAPSLTITAPVANDNVAAGSTVTVSLSANDSDGFISKHQVFVNGSLVDTDGTNYTPYKLSNISAGTYSIKVTVTDNSGATTSKTVSITAGSSPSLPPPPPPPTNNNDITLVISSPNDGQVFNVGSTVTVNLNASDPDGTITKHQIYFNNKLVDTDGTNYTAHKISNISAGTHTIKAVVTDNSGNTATETVTISVQSGTTPNNDPPPPPPPTNGTAPTLVFNSPVNNQEVAVGSTVSVSISASDPNGSIVKHQIYVDGKLVDTDGAGFTPHKITNITSGSHVIKATVTDNSGEKTSASITITATSNPGSEPPSNPPPTSGNNAPTVLIVSPAKNQNFTVGSTVSIKLSASDSDGNVVKHQIYINNVLVDTDGTFFTPHKMVNAKAGNYTIKATVTDNDGAKTTQTTLFTVGGSTSKQAFPVAGNSPKEIEVLDEIIGIVDGNSDENYLRIASNPVKEGLLQIRQKGNNFLRILNLSGIVVKEMLVEDEALQIDLSGLSPGLYILSSESKTTKFILN